MKSWSRIHRDCSDSRRLSELIAKHPFADGLFWRIKAWADDYGRFLADPMKVTAKVLGRAAIEFGVTMQQVAEALDVLEALGLIQRYDVDSEQYLELCDYDKHDAPLWLNVSRPEYPAPPWWTPPDSLVAFLVDNLQKRNVTLARYGIDANNCPGALRACLASVEQHPEPCRTDVEQPVQQPVHQTVEQGSEHTRPTLTLTQDNTNGNDLLSESADDALPDAAIDAPPADPPDTTPKRKQRKAMTDDEAESMIALARADLPPGCLDLVETLMDLVAAQNKTGRMALSREATLTTDLADKCKRDGIGTDALRHGLTAAIAKGAANINYVIKAANGYDPARASPGQPSRNGKLFITLSDGTRCYEDSPNWSYGMEIGIGEARAEGIWNQRTGCTTVPSRGFCCDDGWFYDSRDDGSMYQARRWNQ